MSSRERAGSGNGRRGGGKRLYRRFRLRDEDSGCAIGVI